MRVHHLLVGSIFTIAIGVIGCQGRLAYNLPPASRLMEPGPGVGGPGPGVIPVPGAGAASHFGGGMPGGMSFGGGGVGQASYCAGCDSQGGGGFVDSVGFAGPASGSTSQIAFLGEEGLEINWDVSGQGLFDSPALLTPGRQDFPQGAIYRLRLSNIAGRAGVVLYPTLEIAPVTPRTDAYLAHAPIPVQFTEEDFDQALSGNFVTKVIYLPDPEFQELALAGVETLVSTRLDPGVDPISEADRRGSILAVVRLGNKDLETLGGVPNGSGNVMPAEYQVDSFRSHRRSIPDPAYQDGAVSDGGEYYGPVQGDFVGSRRGGYQPGYQPARGGQVDRRQMMPPMPQGMPTARFAPQAVPPHQIAGGPQWGMPITGTPIGLPGPPHIPLGAPAGLQKHVMKNRTRVLLPPPTSKVQLSVKQRPGLNYPRPVNRVSIDETQRAPFWLFGSWKK